MNRLFFNLFARNNLLAFISAIALWMAATTIQADDATSDNIPLEEKEKSIDKDHLLKIYAAIQSYKKDQGTLPGYLSDLFPKYLNDPEILMSPVEKRTGESKLYGYDDPKMKSSYIYEFSAVASGRTDSAGKKLSMKEWKTIQMESFGPVIPLLRCHLHTKALNVAFAGDYYESSTFWETDPTTITLAKKLGSGKKQTGGKTFSLSVLTLEDGAPVSGAQMEFLSEDANLGNLAPRIESTDDKGSIQLALGNGTLRQASLTITKSGYVKASASWESGKLPESFTVKLNKAISMGGVVQSQAGQPVSGAIVSLWGTMRDEVGQVFETELESVKTDSQGNWKSTAIPAKQKFLFIRIKHKEFMPTEYEMAATQSENSVSEQDLLAAKAVLRLEPGIRIEGIVRNSEGNPVAKANVSLLYGEEFKKSIRGESDAKGHFVIVMQELCQGHLLVQANGYAPQDKFITIERGLKPFDYSLTKGIVLKGQVIAPVKPASESKPKSGVISGLLNLFGQAGPESKPVAGAKVQLVKWNDLPVIQWSTTTDSEGRFSWDSAPEGELNIMATKDGYNSVTQTAQIKSDTDLKFNLDKLFYVTGKVIDAETQKPISSFRLIRGFNYGGSEERPYWEDGSSTSSKSDGSYTLTQDYRRNATVKIMVIADGYLPQESGWLKETEQHTVDFALKKGKGPEGTVLLPDGQPASGAQVALVGMGYQSLGKASFREMGRANQFLVKTDAQGHFSLPAAMASPTIMTVHEKGYAEITGKALAEKGKIQLQSWGKIEGKLLFGTRLGTNESVMISPEDTGPGQLNYDWDNFKRTTDDQGRFSFEFIPPGPKKMVLLYQTTQNSWNWSYTEWIDVKPGETTHFTFGGKGRPVICKLALSDPKRTVEWKNGHYSISTQYPQPQKPFSTQEEWRKWQSSPKFKTAIKKHRSYSFRVNENGTLGAENIIPGKYQLSFDVREARDSRTGMGAQIGHYSKEIIVEDIPGEVSDEPFDLGTITIPVQK